MKTVLKSTWFQEEKKLTNETLKEYFFLSNYFFSVGEKLLRNSIRLSKGIFRPFFAWKIIGEKRFLDSLRFCCQKVFVSKRPLARYYETKKRIFPSFPSHFDETFYTFKKTNLASKHNTFIFGLKKLLKKKI